MLRFRRQHTIGAFIGDFVCLEAKLVIEIDGDQHGRGEAPVRDARRDASIEGEGFQVLRFWNHEIGENLNGVLETILRTGAERMRARELGVLIAAGSGPP